MDDRDLLAAEHRRFERLLVAVELTRFTNGVKDWDPDLHPRIPRGMPGGGRFVSVVHDLVDEAHTPGFVQGGVVPEVFEIRDSIANLRRKADVEDRLRLELRRILGRDVDVRLGTRMHLQTMKEVAEGLLRSAEDWPEAHLDFVHARPISSREYGNGVWAVTNMHPDGTVGIVFNAGAGGFGNRSRFLATMRQTVDSGRHRPGQDNAAYVAMHEFGHVVHAGTLDTAGRYNVSNEAAFAVERLRTDLGVDFRDQDAMREMIRTRLGEYAMANPDEMVAEAFADHYLSGPDADVLTQEIGEALSAEYRRFLNDPARSIRRPAARVPESISEVDRVPSGKVNLISAVEELLREREERGLHAQGLREHPATGEIKKAMEGEFAGYAVEIHTVRFGFEPNSIQVHGTIRSPSGFTAGTVVRTFGKNRRGHWYAHHDLLRLDPSAQGSGFSREFNGNLIGWYRESGFHHVELLANIDVGGYAWASFGYDFANKGNAERYQRRLERVLEHADDAAAGGFDLTLAGLTGRRREEVLSQIRDIVQRFQTKRFGTRGYPSAFELSQIGRRPGQNGREEMWPGKRMMLGTTWDAVLRL